MFNRKAFEWKHYLIYWDYNYKENYDRIFAGVLRFLTLIELGVCILVPNSIIYPQNRAGKPVINPSGKYMIKLRINGVSRKVNLRCMYLAIFDNPRIIFFIFNYLQKFSALFTVWRPLAFVNVLLQIMV